MGEQNNLFEKLDKIQSGIEEMRQSTLQDETKLREFISNAERIWIYNSGRYEYIYHKKNICGCKIAIIFLLVINMIVAAVPMILWRDNVGILCIPFVPIAVCNILYISFNIAKIVNIKSKEYEIAYDKIKESWRVYFYDDNGIIYKDKDKQPFKLLRIITLYVNMCAGIAIMILCRGEIITACLLVVCIFIFTMILIVIDSKKMKGYSLYFRDKSNIIPYEQVAKFMYDNNLK